MRTEASVCCNEFCLWWWWRCRLKCEALTDVCGIQAGRDLNTLQRSLIWLSFAIQDTPNMLFPGHNIYADCKPLWCARNRIVKVFYVSVWVGRKGKLKRITLQTFLTLLSVCLRLHLPFHVCLFQAGSVPVFVFLLPPSSSDSLPSFSAYLSGCSESGEASLQESVSGEKKKKAECRSSVFSSFLHGDAEQEMEMIASSTAPRPHLSLQRGTSLCSPQPPI